MACRHGPLASRIGYDGKFGALRNRAESIISAPTLNALVASLPYGTNGKFHLKKTNKPLLCTSKLPAFRLYVGE